MARTAEFRLRSERLVLRPLIRSDITEFTRYRNLPDVARYQDWPLPYTRDHAHQLIDDCDRLGRPTPDEWMQLAIDVGGTIVGDIAVWIDRAGHLAMLGYTIAPGHRGRGFATEAVRSLVPWLFEIAGVHRIAAELDPRNTASARVLERCGFDFVGIARGAARSRGSWTDDARYSLLPETWAAWMARPTSPPASIALTEVTSADVRRVGRLEVGFSQRAFVSTVLESIADAAHPPTLDGVVENPWYRAVIADGEHAAFVMVALPTSSRHVPVLWRLIVDRRHQGRGVGAHAVRLVARALVDVGQRELEVSYVDVPGGPAGFYRRLGFVPTGVVVDGETWARASLDQLLDGGRAGG